MRLFLDTNVIIDYLATRHPFHESARLLMLTGYVKEHELWFGSPQTGELFYVLSEGGKHSMANDVKAKFKGLRRCARICSVGEAEVDAALESAWPDVEDALVYQAALKVKADAIITRNQKDFEKSSIKVFDCDQFFDWMRTEHNIDYAEIPL